MSHTYTRLLYHVIFSTKERRPLLTADIRPQVFAYMGGIIRELKGSALIINGVDDHVHGLLRLPAALSIADAMRVVKANSSGWVHETWSEHSSFGWQNGYGAFSVSQSNIVAVTQYILNQEDHHRRMTFQEEYLEFLKRHEIDYDERYLWV